MGMNQSLFNLNKNIVRGRARKERIKAFQTADHSYKECGFHCIRTEHIGVKFGNHTILEDINLHIHCKQLTAVIGRNGAGKSTLIKAILGEIKHEGNISFRDIKNNEFADLKMGYVPQNLNIAKNTPTSVYDLFASYISNVPVFLVRKRKLYESIKNQLKIYDAQDLIDKAVCDLSGGELQRVLLSIAITPVPNLLLLDEPFTGIDQNGMELFYKNIQKLKEEYGLAIILISHDFNFVKKYADRVVLLDKTIIKEGSAEIVLSSNEFRTVFDTVK